MSRWLPGPRTVRTCLFAWTLVSTTSLCLAQDDKADVRQQILASAKGFAKTFSEQDAKALAEMWVPDGEYVNENGQRFEGRDAIRQEYEQFFKAYPGVKLNVAVDSVRILNPTLAIEEGHTSLEPLPNGAPVASRYTAIHVKQPDGWKMASVRDTRIETPSAYDQLRSLEWLVGHWTSEHAGVTAEVSCDWAAQKSYLELSFNIKQNGLPISSSKEIIGWDPLRQQVVSWSFSSQGGRAVGVWTAAENRWIVEKEGVSGQGDLSITIDIWSPLEGDAWGWRSVVRTVGGEQSRGIRDVVFQRATSAAADDATSSPGN